MLLLPIEPTAQKNVLAGIIRFSQESDDKIREGFLHKLHAMNENDNIRVVLSYFDNKENDRQPGFDIAWYQFDGESLHPHEKRQRPYMVGGLILHSNGEWGTHT